MSQESAVTEFRNWSIVWQYFSICQNDETKADCLQKQRCPYFVVTRWKAKIEFHDNKDAKPTAVITPQEEHRTGRQ